jgi:hypothetical protein
MPERRTRPEWDFFIAHAGADTASAEELFDRLKSASRVFLDSRCLRLGDDWDRKLAEAQRAASVTVVLISSRTEQAYYQREEIAAAITLARANEDEHRVVPVYLDPETAASDALHYGLRLKHGLTLSGEITLDTVASRLLDLLPSPSGAQSSAQHHSTTPTVLLDESYGKWTRTPPDSVGYSNVLQTLADTGTDVRTNRTGYATQAALRDAWILILPTPRKTTIDLRQIEVISDWVRRGGSLLLMGFYLVQEHHANNINSLARRLGLEFKDNLIMPGARFEGQRLGERVDGKQFLYARDQAFEVHGEWCVPARPESTPASHPILDSVHTVALISSCTIEWTQQPELAVCTSDPVAILHGVGVKDSEGYFALVQDYILDRRGPGCFLVAVRHGAGKVAAVGTWKAFLNEVVARTDNQNGILFQNIIAWLSS